MGSNVTKAARPTSARFEGFADRDGRFFRALARNQRREWFEAHRGEYEHGWLAPMKALLAEVRERIDALFPHHPLGEPKVFRIYRDVRFSRDKSPYKTHIGGYVAIDGAGRGPSAPAALYVHLGATEVFVAAGHYMMDPGQLAHLRRLARDAHEAGRTTRGVARVVGRVAPRRSGVPLGDLRGAKRAAIAGCRNTRRSAGCSPDRRDRRPSRPSTRR